MKLLDVISGGLLSLVKEGAKIADKFHFSGEEKAKFTIELEKLASKTATGMEKTLSQVITAHTKIVLAELKQDDLYTKRMRPTIGYAGLAIHIIQWAVNYVAFLNGVDLTGAPALPSEFTYAWMGVTGTYMAGRSLQKYGSSNKALELITGKRTGLGILD